VVYAYPTGNIFPLFSVCVFAEFMSILYIIFYTYHCSDRVYVAKAVGLGLVVFVPVTVYLILAEVDVIDQSDDQVGDILGYLAVAMNFVLYLSPLEKVKQVLVTKSAASIPVLMSGAIGSNSLLWFVTGVVDHDIFLLVPNAVGAVLGAVQVLLYFIYHPGRTATSKDDLERQDLVSPTIPAFEPLASPLFPFKP
jgi:solute carrier family 50 protein (sugar transporter)